MVYDVEFVDYEGLEEVNVCYILVKEKEEVEVIIGELDGGVDFVEFVKEKLIGFFGFNGGDLGYFGKG